jgi:hypothetical protein
MAVMCLPLLSNNFSLLCLSDVTLSVLTSVRPIVLVLGRCSKEYVYEYTIKSHVEAGSNTSTIALRVVGDDEKGSLESTTLKCGHESHGTRTRD